MVSSFNQSSTNLYVDYVITEASPCCSSAVMPIFCGGRYLRNDEGGLRCRNLMFLNINVSIPYIHLTLSSLPEAIYSRSRNYSVIENEEGKS